MTQTHNKRHHDDEKEGVIKYQLRFHHQALSDDALQQYFPQYTQQSHQAIQAIYLDDINKSRTLLKAKGLIGQDPRRYAGDGFGNISIRLKGQTFLISGSQTGHLESLTDQDIALVQSVDVQQNSLLAYGLTKPSSESLTHGVCFETFERIRAVIHVHSPDIWHATDSLYLPFTDEDIPYGTPQMAQAVSQLLRSHHHEHEPTVFVMKGHQDGVVAVGGCLDSCTSSLLDLLNQSMLMKRHV